MLNFSLFNLNRIPPPPVYLMLSKLKLLISSDTAEHRQTGDPYKGQPAFRLREGGELVPVPACLVAAHVFRPAEDRHLLERHLACRRPAEDTRGEDVGPWQGEESPDVERYVSESEVAGQIAGPIWSFTTRAQPDSLVTWLISFFR